MITHSKPLELIPRKRHIKLKLSGDDVDEQLKGSSHGLKTPSCSDLISCDVTTLLEPLSREQTDSTGRLAAGGWKWSIPPCHIFLLGPRG